MMIGFDIIDNWQQDAELNERNKEDQKKEGWRPMAISLSKNISSPSSPLTWLC